MCLLTLLVLLCCCARLLDGVAVNPGRSFQLAFTQTIEEIVASVKFRNADFRSSVTKSFDAFILSQRAFGMRSKFVLDAQRRALEKLYEEIALTKRNQEKDLDDLIKEGRLRRMGMDDSLEAFSKLYNESMAVFSFGVSPSRPSRKIPGEPLVPTGESFTAQMDHMNRAMASSWEAVVGAASGVTARAEEAFQSTVEDFQGLQTRLMSTANGILSASITKSGTAERVGKQALLRELVLLERRFLDLEREGQKWIEQRATMLESSIKLIRESLAKNNFAYEELLSRRRASLYYTAMSDTCLSQVLKLIDLSTAKGWKLIREEDGYVVYRKMMGSSGPGSQYACVMCSGIINSPPKDVFALFEDNTRVPEYNSFYLAGKDLEIVAENTKITWAATPPVFPFKARDFCTLVHNRKLKDGTFVVLNKAIKHPDAPPKPGYVRGSIVLGANIIKPVPGNSRKTHLTMLTQLDPGGFAPPVAVNHICTLGPVGFMRNVEATSKKKPGLKVVREKARLQALNKKQRR